MRFTNRRCCKCYSNIWREETDYGYDEWCLLGSHLTSYKKKGEIMQPLTKAVTSRGGEHKGFKEDYE